MPITLEHATRTWDTPRQVDAGFSWSRRTRHAAAQRDGWWACSCGQIGTGHNRSDARQSAKAHRENPVRTPAEWCAARGWTAHDDDGWTQDGSDWNEPCSLIEFAARIFDCSVSDNINGVRNLMAEFDRDAMASVIGRIQEQASAYRGPSRSWN